MLIRGGVSRRAIGAARAVRNAGCRRRARRASLPSMRAPNYYAHPGFERAGLRRREPEWIRERVLDPASVFIPVWRTQNLIIEIAESEPRAASITVEGLLALLGALDDLDERLARGEFVFLGLIDERAHFALDVSAIETPLEMLRSPALAAAGVAQAGGGFAALA